MITTFISLILLYYNQYLINYSILILILVCINQINYLNLIENQKLLFNSYTSYDNLSFTIILISGLICIWLISLYSDLILININKTKIKLNYEFIAFVFLLIIGLTGLITTNSYLSLFVSIELQSLILYILFATNITPLLLINTSKVSLSYLINAATVTALLLFGIAINSTILCLICVIWKLGVIPLHVWSLPILDNQNNIIISIYLTITKYGYLIIISLIASSNLIAIKLLTYIGLLNLTIGNVLGLLQFRFQRLITYSSLIQIGYMLLILSNQTSLGLTYFQLYSFYTIMLLILWIVPIFNIKSGLLPGIQLFILIIVLYTVAGLPFFPLFWTKLDILLNIESQSLIIGLIGTLLSSLIYIRLIKYITFYKYYK